MWTRIIKAGWMVLLPTGCGNITVLQPINLALLTVICCPEWHSTSCMPHAGVSHFATHCIWQLICEHHFFCCIMHHFNFVLFSVCYLSCLHPYCTHIIRLIVFYFCSECWITKSYSIIQFVNYCILKIYIDLL